MTVKLETAASLRADFMRRWFGIAISVGFATTVVSMEWVQNGTTPNYTEKEQLARLAVALLATILSWEGYLLSIQRKPLADFGRFLLDVLLVFLYLFLLITSKFSSFWLFLHALSFSLYIAWDFLTILLYRDKFVTNEVPVSLLGVYWRGLIGKADIDRGPIITIFWACYFLVIYLSSNRQIPFATFVYAGFVLLGLVGYRLDKGHFRNRALVTPVATIGLSAFVLFLLEILEG